MEEDIEMKIRIKKNIMMFYLPIVLLSIYTFTRGGANLLISNSIWMISLTVVLVCSIFNFFKYGGRMLNLESALLILMILIIICWNNQDFSHGKWLNQYILLVYFIFLLSAMKTDLWFDIAYKMMMIMAFFHSFWTIVCFVKPDVFIRYIYPVVESITYYDIIPMVNKGFIIGFNYSNSQNAIYLSMGLCTLISATVFSQKNKKYRCLYIIGIVMMSISLLLTGKRGPILWLFLGFIITYYFYNSNKVLGRWFKLFSIAVIVIVIFIIGSYFIPSLMNFVIRFQEQIAAGDISTHRFELWSMGMEDFFSSPLIGKGWYWFSYNNLFGLNHHVHNCYIQWLCELGIIGSLPFFTFLILSYIRSIKLVKKIRSGVIKVENKTMKLMAFSLMYQTYFIIYCFFGTAFYEPEILLPWVFSCAMVFYNWRKYKTNNIINKINRKGSENKWKKLEE